jgi:hypothetical protein
LLGLSFDPDDGVHMFLQKVGWLAVGYAVLYRRRKNCVCTVSGEVHLKIYIHFFPHRKNAVS